MDKEVSQAIYRLNKDGCVSVSSKMGQADLRSLKGAQSSKQTILIRVNSQNQNLSFTLLVSMKEGGPNNVSTEEMTMKKINFRSNGNAHEEEGQTKALIRRRLFESLVLGNTLGRNVGHSGGRSFCRGESSISVPLERDSHCHRMVKVNLNDNISDSNILNCNRLFWSRQNLSSLLQILELGKELGVTFDGEQGVIVEGMERMEARDRKIRNVKGDLC